MKLNPTNIAIVKRLLVGRNSRPLRSILQRVEPADLASFLTQLHRMEKKRLIDALISVQKAGIVLVQLPESQLASLLDQIEDEKLSRILKHSSISDGSVLLQSINQYRHEDLLKGLQPEHQEKLPAISQLSGRLSWSDYELSFLCHAGQFYCSAGARTSA